MKNIFFILVLIVSCNVNGAILNFSGPHVPVDLTCPVIKKNALDIKKVIKPSSDRLEIPDEDDIKSFLDIKTNTKAQSINLSKLNNDHVPSLAVWGDSHMAAGIFTDEIARGLAIESTEVQPQFIPALFGRGGVKMPVKRFCKDNGWKTELAYRTRVKKFSESLAAMSSDVENSFLWVDFRNSTNEPALNELAIQSEILSQDATLGISIDDAPEQELSYTELSNSNSITIKSDTPFSIVKIRLIKGKIALHGFIPRYVRTPKLYLDVLAIPGAISNGLQYLNLSNKASDASLKTNPYDLVFIEFGTNEGADTNFNPMTYKQDLSLSLSNFRKNFPDSRCVLIGPPDRGVLIRRSYKTKKNHQVHKIDVLKFSKVHSQIAAIQVELSESYKCGFWDWQGAMGGQGSAYKWLKESPPLFGRELTHLSYIGYQRSAQIFMRDLNLNDLIRN